MILNIPTLGFTNALIIFFIVIGSVSFHEFTHAFIAHLRGDDTAKYNGRMTLNPAAHFEMVGFLMMLFTNFGWGKPVPVNESNLQNPRNDGILVSIAGPLSNLTLALISAAIAHILVLTASTFYVDNPILVYILSMIVVINVGLAIFNLLPIPPLDGSSIWREFLPLSIRYRINGMSFQYIMLIFILAFFPIFNGSSLISLIISPLIQGISTFLLP